MSEPALQADGFESAVLGVVCMPCSSQHVIVYDRKACIEVLTSRDGCPWKKLKNSSSST